MGELAWKIRTPRWVSAYYMTSWEGVEMPAIFIDAVMLMKYWEDPKTPRAYIWIYRIEFFRAGL